jgi:hypothetical protein
LSRERATVPGADVVTVTEGHTSGGVSASLRRPGVVKDPSMHGRFLTGNREIVCHERKPEGFAELYGR